ncbi:MAG: VTT domain-containing protein [Anaerolineae bacterium]|nr:VTT domain-containing protein [Anaerolineae bacterium]
MHDDERRKKNSLPAAPWPVWLRVTVGVFFGAALLAPLILWRPQITALFIERGRVIEVLRGAGAWGPGLLIGLYVVQVIAAPIPGQAINFVAGYLYGFWPGLTYSWAGAVLGSWLAMGLARVAGRPLVVRLVGPALVDRLDRLAAGRGLGFFFLIFLIPGLPDDAACFLAGLTRLPIALLLITAAIGRVPGIVLAVWAGAAADRMDGRGWMALAVVASLAALLVWRWGARIQERLMAALDERRRGGR